jgi:hypothetical protein
MIDAVARLGFRAKIASLGLSIRRDPFVEMMLDGAPNLRRSIMAQYLILIYETEESYAKATEAELNAVMAAHNRFAEQVAELGATMVGGNALQPTMTATTIRSDIVTDGPFVETKEALGGYYLIEAADLDQALAVGKLCPAPYGGVEVRPIMTF